MDLLVLLLVQFLYIFVSNGDISNGKGYHAAIGIPKAYKLMSEEGFVTRIVGGQAVSAATLYPYQAGIIVTLTTSQTSLCGGALVSNTRVLTAAHCWWDGQIQARQFTIVLGSLRIFSGGTRIITKEVTVHPNWNTKDISHDIAMVKISRVTYSSSIQAVSLPASSDSNQNFAGLVAVATGYGKTRDGLYGTLGARVRLALGRFFLAQNGFPSTTSLYHISLKVITNGACQSMFDMPLHASQLCTDGGGGVGACDGDSGGPLTTMWKNKRTLVGIVSFGLADGCQAGYPSVYTRVTSFLPWIQANL